LCGRSLAWLGHRPPTTILNNFYQFCIIDLQRSERTAKDNIYQIKRFLSWFGKDPSTAIVDDVRNYLSRFSTANGYSPNTYSNVLKSLKIFFRDYLNMEYLVKTFRFPPKAFSLIMVPTKEQLQKFYFAIDNLRGEAFFLLLATSGRRLNEALSTEINGIDLDKRMIIPDLNSYASRTKRCWYSFFNDETKIVLEKYLDEYEIIDRIFPIKKREAQKYFDRAKRRTGIHITAKTLRQWFCCQMGELGVPDRYIDAFCGRVPRSILARHYTDYSPERLKRIYDKANLRVLS